MHWLSGTGHVLWANETEMNTLGYALGRGTLQQLKQEDLTRLVHGRGVHRAADHELLPRRDAQGARDLQDARERQQHPGAPPPSPPPSPPPLSALDIAAL
eukprot:121917-Rhodomonas_salina.1